MTKMTSCSPFTLDGNDKPVKSPPFTTHEHMKAALAISLALFVMIAQMLSLHFQSQVPPGSTSSAPTSNPTLASTIKDRHTAFTSVGLVRWSSEKFFQAPKGSVVSSCLCSQVRLKMIEMWIGGALLNTAIIKDIKLVVLRHS
ncbi:hypothetical protein P8452_55671 [Trifolium repens]|nr:hypothetical protein P8452_55671 [Trifolium repens]